MSSAVRRLAQQVPRFSKGFKTSSGSQAGGVQKHGHGHEEVVYGDGHHGLRKGYNYDYEHGPHYLWPEKVTNFWPKLYGGMAAMYVVGLGIPVFAVWYQQRKLKTG